MSEKVIRGLSCPGCGGSLEVIEGSVLAKCEFCGAALLVQGDRGIPRYYVNIEQKREAVVAKAKGWLTGIDKASDLKTAAQFTEVFPVFVPFWRVNATVIGWVLGDVKKGSGKNTTWEAVERKVCKKYEFTCPACDIGEFGVKYIDLNGDQILPFNLEKVQAQGMTFGVLTSPADVVNMCDQKFIKWGEDSAGVTRQTFSKLYMIGRTTSIVYYPLWVIRYQYRGRIYQIVADGESGDILYGRAPGNNLYRIGAFLASVAGSNFIFTSLLRGKDVDGQLIIGGFIFCVFLIVFGFRKLRYGGEVKKEQSSKDGTEVFSQLFPAMEGRSISSLKSAFQEISKYR